MHRCEGSAYHRFGHESAVRGDHGDIGCGVGKGWWEGQCTEVLASCIRGGRRTGDEVGPGKDIGWRGVRFDEGDR